LILQNTGGQERGKAKNLSPSGNQQPYVFALEISISFFFATHCHCDFTTYFPLFILPKADCFSFAGLSPANEKKNYLCALRASAVIYCFRI